MKKILFAVLASTFATALMGADFVYDFKASIKRIEPSYKLRTVNKAKTVTSSYNVVSDTLSGYIIVPRCKACASNGASFVSSVKDMDGTAYIIRKGDKYKKSILKTPVAIDSAIFGAYIDAGKKYDTANGEKAVPLASIRDAKKAWMGLAFLSNDSIRTIDSTEVLKNINKTTLNYGFLGFDNLSTVSIKATGFGTVTHLGEKEKTDLGFCGPDVTDGWSCIRINTISGTLIGTAEYDGPCKQTPMWDLCYSTKDPVNTDFVTKAVVTGTWTLKYNKTLSEKVVDDNEKVDEIINKKLKGYTQDTTNVKEAEHVVYPQNTTSGI